MHDNQIEDRLRSVLRREGDDLTLNITAQELERRLALRRRARAGRRLSLVAAGIAVIVIGGVVAAGNGWFGGAPVVGGKPVTSVAPVETPHQSFGPLATPLAGISPIAATLGRTQVLRIDPTAPQDRSSGTATSGATGPMVIGSMSCIGAGTLNVTFNDRDETLPCGDRLSLRANIWFEVRGGAVNLKSVASGPVSFAILVEEPAPGESAPTSSSDTCTPLDPSSSGPSPAVVAGTVPGDSLGYGGTVIASRWNGVDSGTPGSWDGLPGEPDAISVGPDQTLEITSDGCFADVNAEALLTVYAQPPVPSPTPVALKVVRGVGSRVVDIEPPATGGWTVRVRATFVTRDGSTAWSESLYRVFVTFEAPKLTLSPAGASGGISADGNCPSFHLANGASASDQCGGPYEPITGIDPLVIARGSPVDMVLADGWQLGQVKVTAVDADLVAAGKNAPEYSVAFIDKGGPKVTTAVVLDPGSWIVRVSLNGSRGDDTFGAWYDLPVTITR